VSSLPSCVAELAAVAAVALGPTPLAAMFAGCGPARGSAERWLAVLVAWCALQTALGIGLAAAGLLGLLPLLLAEAALFAAGVHLGRRAGRAPHLDGDAGAARDPYALVVLGAIGVLGIDLGIRLVFQPLADHDSLGYHLPALARWVQAGGLVPLERVDQAAHYPYSWELLAALLVLPVGQDLLVAVPNLIAWAILGLAIVAAAMRLGAPRPHALTGAFCVLALELTRATTHSTHVDLALAAFFLSSVAFALAGNVAGWLTGLGLVAGMKTNGLLLAGAGLAAGAFLGLGARMPRRALAVVVPALAVGAFWYARNLIETGNPLGLVRVAVDGMILLPGSVDPAALARTTLASQFDVGDPAQRDAATRLLAGKLGLPGLLLVSGSLGLVRTPARAGVRPVVAVVALLLVSTALYATTPFSAMHGVSGAGFSPAGFGENMRYALPALGLLGVTGAAGAARLVGAGTVTLAAVLVFADSTSARTLPAAIAIALTAATIAIVRSAPRRTAWLLALAAAAAAVGGWSSLRAQHDAARARAYGVALERTIRELPAGTVVAHVRKSDSYPLYGPRFTNRVRHVPAASRDPEEWLRALRDHGASLVALGPLTHEQAKRPEVGWLADPAGPFVQIVGHDPRRETVLYRLR
jgi:hypothetical protein